MGRAITLPIPVVTCTQLSVIEIIELSVSVATVMTFLAPIYQSLSMSDIGKNFRLENFTNIFFSKKNRTFPEILKISASGKKIFDYLLPLSKLKLKQLEVKHKSSTDAKFIKL